MLARTSKYKVPTTLTAEGCIRLLEMYGRSVSEIADTVITKPSTIKDILRHRNIGKKYLDKLQQLVHQVELSSTG